MHVYSNSKGTKKFHSSGKVMGAWISQSRLNCRYRRKVCCMRVKRAQGTLMRTMDSERKCYRKIVKQSWNLYILLYKALYTLNRKKYQKVFVTSCTKPDRFWQNLVRNVLSKFFVQKCKRFPPNWIMSLGLHYLVKVSIHGLQVNGSWNCERRNTPKCFYRIFYKTRLILMTFGAYFPD